MITFTCTQCQRLLQVPEQSAGKRCKCSQCGAVVTVPEAEPAASAVSSTWSEAGLSAFPDGATLPPSSQAPGPRPPAPPPANAPADFSAHLAPPQGPGEIGRLGCYRIIRLLGSGGMGMVFQAEDTKLNRAVALKVMQPTLAVTAENRQRFVQEGRAAAAVEHDHIITIYQVDEDRGLPFLAMQLLHGETLEARLQRHRGPQPMAFVVRIGRQIAEGLEAAHRGGLVHRDIKPSNIWLEEGRDRVKILDFGLARVVHAASQLTQTGMILGTPGYLAPEQVGGHAVGTACDLFSLGVVLYRMCTGALPFQGTDTLSILTALATTKPREVRELNAQVPAPLAILVMRLLAREAAQRPKDREVTAALAAIERELPEKELTSAVPAFETQAVEMNEVATTIAQASTAPARRKAVPLIVGLGIGAFLLVTLVCGGSIVAWLVWPLKPTGQVAIKDPTSPVVEPAPEREALATVRDALARKQHTKTKIVGFTAADEFTDVPPKGALLIGFDVGLGKFTTNDVIHSLRPIYLTDDGEVKGAWRGTRTERVVTVKAKPGYAVAGITLETHLLIDGLRITFMRIEKNRLKREDSYDSEWVADGRNGTPLSLNGDLVIGICGRSGPDKICALGLVFLDR
jgi:serine/threonine protein kinase